MPRTALIIEDSATMRHLIRLVLAGEALDFIEAANATDGINLAINREPDIILADETLDGMTAVEICQRLKQEYCLDYIPFLVMSGQIHRYDHAKGLLAGVDDVVPKPFEAEDFVKKVRDLLLIYRDRRPEKTGAWKRSSAAPVTLAESSGATDPDAAPVSDLDGAAAPSGESPTPSPSLKRPTGGEEVVPLAGITYDIYGHEERTSPEEAYCDPIASFLGGPEPEMVVEREATASAAMPPGNGSARRFREPKETPRVGTALPSDPAPFIRVESEEARAKAQAAAPRMMGPVGDARGMTAAADRPDLRGGSAAPPEEPSAAGLNLADDELERLVALEIRRRLAQIRLQDLEREIKSIFHQALDATIQRMLPQIKTEIILTVVKMLKNK